MLSATISVVLYAIQVLWLMGAMVRVTRPGVPHNSFRKILALNLGTIPVVGFLVARRWDEPVRSEVMRVHTLCVVLTVLGLFLP